MLYKFLFLLVMFVMQDFLHAQEKSNIKFGKIELSDFTVPVSGIIDSNTNGVIISDAGFTYFKGNRNGWFSYVFKKTTRIKIINKKGFDLATVKIRFYTSKNGEEKLDKLAATCYNIENGKVTETKMEKADIFEDKLDKHYIEKRFSIPGVKEGSIIEYTYTITSDFDFNLPEWQFQSVNYPCLWSQYEVIIPEMLIYVFVKQGIHSFFRDKVKQGHERYLIVKKRNNDTIGSADQEITVSANTIGHEWVMKDLPALTGEDFISTPENYVDKINFQLSKYFNGEEHQDVMNTWRKASEELLAREDFGQFLHEDNTWLNSTLEKIIMDVSGKLSEAKNIYYYINSNFTCTNYYNKYLSTTLRDVIRKKAGSVGDLNLLLVAMLRQRNIDADPVLLSTREFGTNLSGYPMMERLNYVICRARIEGNIYYLDAAHSKLGFGYLPANCYNGHARIISDRDSGSVFFHIDSLKEQKTTSVIIVNDDANRLSGNFQSTPGYYESFELREKWNTGGERSFLNDLKSGYYSDIEIKDLWIDSLKKNEYPVRVSYNFFLKAIYEEDILYFNPMMSQGYKKNPFKSAERIYPVEMPYTIDDRYTLQMDVPRGFVVDELPRQVVIKLNDQGDGIFEYRISNSSGIISFRSHIRLNRANFLPEEYESLREFFNLIVKKQSEQIVFKKKK